VKAVAERMGKYLMTRQLGFVLRGIDAGDLSGSSVSSAGDVNGDGIDDIIVGAHRADPNGPYSPAGESYVVFGAADGSLPTSMDATVLSSMGSGLAISADFPCLLLAT
jgi:hypothetical protein